MTCKSYFPVYSSTGFAPLFQHYERRWFSCCCPCQTRKLAHQWRGLGPPQPRLALVEGAAGGEVAAQVRVEEALTHRATSWIDIRSKLWGFLLTLAGFVRKSAGPGHLSCIATRRGLANRRSPMMAMTMLLLTTRHVDDDAGCGDIVMLT